MEFKLIKVRSGQFASKNINFRLQNGIYRNADLSSIGRIKRIDLRNSSVIKNIKSTKDIVPEITVTIKDSYVDTQLLKLAHHALTHVKIKDKERERIIKSAEDAGLTPLRIIDLFKRMARYCDGNLVFRLLPEVLREVRDISDLDQLIHRCKEKATPKEAANNYKADNIVDIIVSQYNLESSLPILKKEFSLEKISTLLGEMAEKTGYRKDSAIKSLQSALEIGISAGLSVKQSAVLFLKILETTGTYEPYYFAPLSSVIEEGIKAGYTLDHLASLFEKIIISSGESSSHTFKALPNAFEAAAKAGLSFEQLSSLCDIIAVESTEKSASHAFNSLSTALEAGINAGFSADQLLFMIENIVKNTGKSSYHAFFALPASLKAGTKAGISGDRLYTFLLEIVSSTGKNAHHALEALPQVLETKLSPDKIPGLFKTVEENSMRNASIAFRALPSALEAGLTIEQIPPLFRTIIKGAGKNAQYSLKALPSLIKAGTKAGFSFDELSSLVGIIIKNNGKVSHSVFETLTGDLDEGSMQKISFYLSIALPSDLDVQGTDNKIPSLMK